MGWNLGWWIGWLVGVLATFVLGATLFQGVASTVTGFILLLILYVIIDLCCGAIGATIQHSYREHHSRKGK